MANASSPLDEAVRTLSSASYHASIRNADDGSAFVFVVGPRRLHSLELKQLGDRYHLSLWKGPDGRDTVARQVTVNSFGAAMQEAERWLRNEDG